MMSFIYAYIYDNIQQNEKGVTVNKEEKRYAFDNNPISYGVNTSMDHNFDVLTF
jgi:hypothetical protein